MSSDAVWGTVVGLLIVVIIGLSIAIYHYRRQSQKYQVANANGEGVEMQATTEENQVSNTTLDDIELGAIDATETAGTTTDVARDVGSAAIETTDKKEEITMKFQDEKNDSGDSNDSSDESENTFVVHSSQKSIQSPLAIYNDLKRRFSLSFAASAASAASAVGQTTTYIPGVTSGDKNNNNNNDSKDTKSDNGNGKGKGLKENLLLSSKNGEAKEKGSKVRARQSSMPAPSACRITRYHARLPSKIFLENKLKRLSITTANKTLNGDEDVIDVYSVSGKEEKEKQGEAGDGKENKKQNDKKQDGKNKIENGSSGKPANLNNNNNNSSEKPFPKITIVTNVSNLGKPDKEKEKEKATPLISTPQTTIINPTPISPVIIVTPSGARTRDSVEDELNEENVVSLNGIVSGVVVGIDRRRRSSTNSFSFSSGYSSSPDLAETLTELPSNGPPSGNDVLINNILARKSESETKNSNSGGGIAKDKGKGEDLQTEKRSNNPYVFEDRKNSTNKKTIKTGKSKAKANGKVGKSNKPKELTSIVTEKQHGERQGRARKESSIGRGSPLRRQRERRVGLPKRVKSPLVGSSQRNSRNNSRRNSRNSITLQISNDFDIDDDGEHSSICDGWDRTKIPRVAAQPILVQSPFYNTGNDKSSNKMIKKTPVIEISKKFQSNARDKNVKTDKMDSLGRVTRTTRSVTPKKCKCHQDCNHNGKNGKRASRNTVRGAGTGGNDGKKRTGSKKIGKNQNGKSKNGESKSHRQSVSLSPNRPRKSKGKKENLVAIDFKKQAKRIKTGVNDENNTNLNRPQWF